MSDGLSPPRVFLTFSNSEIESWGIKRDAGGVEYIRHDCTDIPQLYALADIRAAIGDSNGRMVA